MNSFIEYKRVLSRKKIELEYKIGRETNLPWEKILAYFGFDFKIRSTGVCVALCPYHCEKTPSMHMWPKSGRLHCFGCGVNRDKFDFICNMLGIISEHDLDTGLPWMLLRGHVPAHRDQLEFDFDYI